MGKGVVSEEKEVEGLPKNQISDMMDSDHGDYLGCFPHCHTRIFFFTTKQSCVSMDALLNIEGQLLCLLGKGECKYLNRSYCLGICIHLFICVEICIGVHHTLTLFTNSFLSARLITQKRYHWLLCCALPAQHSGGKSLTDVMTSITFPHQHLSL